MRRQPLAYEAQEIASREKVVVELVPARPLKTAEANDLKRSDRSKKSA